MRHRGLEWCAFLFWFPIHQRLEGDYKTNCYFFFGLRCACVCTHNKEVVCVCHLLWTLKLHLYLGFYTAVLNIGVHIPFQISVFVFFG